jgi:hypothetical protein
VTTRLRSAREMTISGASEFPLLRDPFGHLWSLATPREELCIEDIEERADKWARGDLGG